MHRAWHADPRVLLQLTPADWAVIVTLLVIGLAVKAFVLWWLYQDTTRRDQPPLWWLVAAVPFDLPTLVVWLIVRPPLPEEEATPSHASRRTQAIAPEDPLTAPPEVSGTSDGSGMPGGRDEPASEEKQNGTARVTCPHCSTRFHVEARDQPQRVQCPSCAATGTIAATR